MSNSSEKQLDLFGEDEELFTISVPDGDVTIDVDYNYADDLFATVDFEEDLLFDPSIKLYEPEYQFVELKPTEYKFREDELIDEFIEYIDSTYAGHYGAGGLQSFEIIVDRGHGMGFTAGNIDKYNDRYGKKGNTPDEWRKDIMKTIHYAFLKLYEHDRLYGTPNDE